MYPPCPVRRGNRKNGCGHGGYIAVERSRFAGEGAPLRGKVNNSHLGFRAAIEPERPPKVMIDFRGLLATRSSRCEGSPCALHGRRLVLDARGGAESPRRSRGAGFRGAVMARDEAHGR